MIDLRKSLDMIETKYKDIPKSEKTCNRCKDFDEDCWGILDKLNCFLRDPEQGNCPFLTGEIKDDTI